MLMLAAMYERGCGLAKDPQQGNHWYQLTHRALSPLAESGCYVRPYLIPNPRFSPDVIQGF
jgi:hypothetical protein